MIRDTYEANTRVSLITLDRADVKNALDPAHWAQLAEVVLGAVSDGARAIVLTGAGDAFCAGADLNGIDLNRMSEAVEGAFEVIRSVPIPVIAHINGPAVGAGAQLIVSCDLRVAAESAWISIPAASISLPAHPGTIERLVALAGNAAARAILLGGERLTSRRAYGLGLVDRLGGLDETMSWAARISGYAPLVMSYFKTRLQVENPADATEYDDLLRTVADSPDFAEAMQARQERRSPAYRG